MTESADRLGSGAVVLVVGPSGAGKDTLLTGAAERFAADPSVVFPRRLVTREADPDLEDHGTISGADYAAMKAEGDFSLCWEAHGHGYVIPKEADEAVGEGRTVVFNASRGAIAGAAAKYRRIRVVLVTVPDAILKQRLEGRARETADEIEGRLRRAAYDMPPGDYVTVVNDGTIAEGVDALAAVIADAAAATDQAFARN